MLKTIYKIIASLILIIFISLGSWYVIGYVTYLPDIKKLEKESRAQYGTDIEVVKKLAIIAESKQGINNYAVKGLSFEFRNHESKLMWHANSLLWLFCTNIHFNDEQLFYLWLHVSKINELSMQYYQTPISALTLEQQASIISMVKSPSIFKPNNQRGIERQQWLLKQYHNS